MQCDGCHIFTGFGTEYAKIDCSSLARKTEGGFRESAKNICTSKVVAKVLLSGFNSSTLCILF